MNKVIKPTLNVYPQTKELVNKVKDVYKYKTIDDCISEVFTFIDKNNINPTEPFKEETPTEVYRNDIRMYFDDLRKFQRDDSQSLRKFLGALEKTYLKPLINKLENKDVLQAVDLAKPTPPEPTTSLSDLIAKNNANPTADSAFTSVENSSEVEKLKSKIEALKKANKEALEHIDICKNVLKEISNNMSYIKSFTGSGMLCKIDMKRDVFLELMNRTGVI
ncbi:hypothetical protein [Capnocytophaga sp. oral taxon 878]|uniref:hypothetical protein n=1 Tax=Capnocytophaga sp. oral taxon 878 TaxID=1316596 RepID=UPI000D025CE8|nr:hypothetical protein [Capnocytophaga sp. oral taxon 878]AVM51543.1 hypothetical protein C4H12_13575 [Capnocytophaga sp. oral taxon 878]